MQLQIDQDGVCRVEVEIGMPLTGRNNLAETPLLQLVGDIRWRHIARILGIPSREVADQDGQRLYATFFYVEVGFPEGTPMAFFRENDSFSTANTIRCHENTTVDGFHFLYPEDHPAPAAPLPEHGAAAIARGIPYLRTSNAFVKMVEGASWLKKATPAHVEMDRLPKVDKPPKTYSLILGANEHGYFRRPPAGYVPVTAGRVRTEYQPQSDRDLNGVGLLYFANYPMVLDLAERALLTRAEIPLSHALLDHRTVVRRQSAYLCNIQPEDKIDIFLDAWIQNPFQKDPARARSQPVRLFLNYEMYRRSDGRKMMVSTAEKILHGLTVESAGLASVLAGIAGKASGTPPA